MSNKFVIGGLVIVLFFLLINMFATFNTMNDYETRKQSGNDRWLQVENRILQTEDKVENRILQTEYKVKLLEEEIKEWKK